MQPLAAMTWQDWLYLAVAFGAAAGILWVLGF